MAVEIQEIDAYSPFMFNVKALWRANSDVLGYFPDGAFSDYADKRRILIALDGDQFAGYLLYRIAHGRIPRIVHLSVDPAKRGYGVARALVDGLHHRTQTYPGIGLKCRRDFAVNQMWPRLGFVARNEQAGRSQSGSELTSWWLDHNQPTLWTAAAVDAPETRIAVAIDANVFLDLRNETDPTCEESKSLLVDWLQESIELCITTELLNEIARNENAAQRTALRSFASQFRELPSDKTRFDKTIEQIRCHFPAVPTKSSDSDMRQVARAIAAGVQFFATRDEQLLGKSDDIYEDFRLRIIRPSDLIVRLDELRREAEYQPASLAATPLRRRLVHSGEERQLTDAFRQVDLRETKAAFQAQARRFFSDPQHYECRLTVDEHDQFLTLLVSSREQENALTIHLFRVAVGKLSPTLARYHIRLCLLCCAQEGRTFAKIKDVHLASDVKIALQEEGFLELDDEWVKAVLPVSETAQSIMKKLSELTALSRSEAAYCQGVITLLDQEKATENVYAMAEVERLLWPAKVLNAEIPAFIVPIHPQWAQSMFDTNLAAQTLFGASLALALNREAVYYRSAKTQILQAPARVLWYITKSKEYQGTGSIRACSQIAEVKIGRPKELFRRFRRLGIYEWQHIIRSVHGDLDKEIMAVRFRNTELFPTPIPWDRATQDLRGMGMPSQFQSPHRITSEAFAHFYQLATKKDGQ